PMARALGPLAYGHAQCRRFRRNRVDIRYTFAPAWVPIGRNGEFGTSPFFGQLIGRISLASTLQDWCVGAKHNTSQPLYVLWHTLNSSMSCVVGCRRDDSTNQLQKL